jgi:uncharacterized protein (DUF885 family)
MMQACNYTSDNKKPYNDPKLASICDNYYEEGLKLYPLGATNIGDYRYNDLLPNNISESYRQTLRNFYNGYLDSIKTIDLQSLSESDRISYNLLKWECDNSLEGLTFPFHLTPLDQYWTMQNEIGRLASGSGSQPFKTTTDYRNWLKRLDAYVVWCDTAIANMRKGMQIGFVLPKSLVVKIIPQVEAFDHGKVEEHLFYQPVLNMPDSIADTDKEQIRAEYSRMISEKIIPNYKKLHDFLKNDYLPACRETSGCGALPNGNKIYSYLIKTFTTTDLTADEIYDIGQKEVVRLTLEMEKVKDSVGFNGSLTEFFNFIRTDKSMMPYKEPQQVIDHFNRIYQTIQPHLSELFDKIPKTGFEVKRTEAFREQSASAEYQPGSVDGTRPGRFYVPIPDASCYNVYSDEVLFTHEAIPGHHFQISMQREDTTLPEFRRVCWYNAYGEGWALYCESLGSKLGLYKDPYQYFGMLSMEIHRAIRLVIDVGLHAKGWTREQAIEYSLKHEADSEVIIISEVERYMALPGQALSYKIGQLKILELRVKAEKALGSKFDIRKFHNTILESGCVPISILEERINEWIREEGGKEE